MEDRSDVCWALSVGKDTACRVLKILQSSNGLSWETNEQNISIICTSHLMVWQNLFKAEWKSFCMASSNKLLLSQLPKLHLPCWYLSAASEFPKSNYAQKTSFSLTAPFTTGVHHQVHGLPPQQAPTTLWSQLCTWCAQIRKHENDVFK